MTARLLQNSELGTHHYAQCARRKRWPVLFVYRTPWSCTDEPDDEDEQEQEVSVMLHAESSTGEVFDMALEPHPHSDCASTAILYAPLGRLSYELILSETNRVCAISSGELPIVAMGCVDVRVPVAPPAHAEVATMKKEPCSGRKVDAIAPIPNARVVRRTPTTAYVEFWYEYLAEARDVFVVLPGLDCVRLARRTYGGITGYVACIPHVPYGTHRYRFHVLPHGTLAPRDAPITTLGFDPTLSGATLVTWEQKLVVRQPIVRTAIVRPTVIAALCAAAALAVIARITRARAHSLDDNHHHPDR